MCDTVHRAISEPTLSMLLWWLGVNLHVWTNVCDLDG
eukprot:SAG31_NODE_41806_length_274_cov_0.880000_1_plen_36_part_01